MEKRIARQTTGVGGDAEVRDTTGSIQPEMPLNVIIDVGGFNY